MATEDQRCPACDSAFVEGEAVLRCSVCGVLHHPACWIDGGGCASEPKHDSVPEPVAYHAPEPVLETIPVPPATEMVPGPQESEPEIGRRAVRKEPVNARDQAAGRTTPPLNNPPNPGQLGGRTQRLPTIYTRPGILRFWYLPVGALLAAGAAFAVIWAADQFTGDDSPAVAASPTPTATTEATQTATAGPTEPGSTPQPTATEAPTVVSTAFAQGDLATVSGTGGDCLNVRSTAGLEGDAVDCIDDGTPISVIGGPEEANDFIWWQIQAPNSTGWAVEIYLEPQ